MTTQPTTTAFEQISQWYQRWQQVEMAQPVTLFPTTGAPDEAADQPKTTDATTTTMEIFA